MSKGYWVVTQNNIPDQTKYSAYAKAAKVTLEEFNGKIIIAGSTEIGIEDGLMGLRTVVVEFDTYETALTAYNSSSYQRAIIELHGTLKRNFRIIRGAD
jgi:uncharacterized protein (DUF1330 family)